MHLIEAFFLSKEWGAAHIQKIRSAKTTYLIIYSFLDNYITHYILYGYNLIKDSAPIVPVDAISLD